MSFTFLDTAFDNEKPFFSGAQHQQMGSGPPPQVNQQMNPHMNQQMNPQGQYPPQRIGGGVPLSEMSHGPPNQATAYGAPRSSPGYPMPPQHHAQPRPQPMSSGAPMEHQEISSQQQQEEIERRQYEQLYAMGKLVTTQQEDNALVMRNMKQYCSSLEILLFIIIAFCVVMVIVQIVVCRKVMTLAKMNTQ